MRRRTEIESPKTPNEDVPICGSTGHKCGALKSIEELSHDTDRLYDEIRRMRKEHNEDCRQLWYKIGGLVVALAAVLPTGWASFLGLI